MATNDLRNADLSKLQVNDMTKEQKLELRRRYQNFLKQYMKDAAKASAAPPPPKKHTKWVPTKVIRKPL